MADSDRLKDAVVFERMCLLRFLVAARSLDSGAEWMFLMGFPIKDPLERKIDIQVNAKANRDVRRGAVNQRK